MLSLRLTMPLSVVVFIANLILATPSHAARCGGDFNTFVAAMSAEAQAAGISPVVISQALSGVTQDPGGTEFRPAPARHIRRSAEVPQ
jgi:membrane-bound lytic murein transglycosylase B